MIDGEQRLLDERLQDEWWAQRKLELWISGGILGLPGGVLAAVLFSKAIGRRVRRLEEGARQLAEGVPIGVRLTGRGYTDSRVRGYCLLVASTPVLQKPFDSASLTQRVREALGDARSKRLEA